MVAVELTCATINTDMTRLENDLARACEALGIRMDLGFKLSCPDGHEVRSIARLHAVGAPNGMLVVGTFEEVEDYCNYLDSTGFGYSVLDEPGDNEVFDLESNRQMFCEWGWPEGNCA
jgi:hypothetical protein